MHGATFRFVQLHRLSDGSHVLLREIRPDDRHRLAAGLRELSPESVYRRFLSPKPRLTSSELSYLTEVDFVDHYALVAMSTVRLGEIVGVGRWVRSTTDATAAEVAVVVADPLQGKGLGKELGRRLAAAARERGVERFTATMHADNVAAHHLFDHIAASLHVEHDGGVDELVAVLAA